LPKSWALKLFGETLFTSEGGQQSGILLDEVACYQYTTFDSLLQQPLHQPAVVAQRTLGKIAAEDWWVFIVVSFAGRLTRS
jgi:hypothetical protein